MTLLAVEFQAILVVIGIIVARAALSTARTPQGAAAWVVFLVSFPLLALPAYALFASAARINARNDDRHTGLPTGADTDGRLSPLRPITHMDVTAGNDLRLLIDGPATFEAIFAAIDAAEDEILVQFYIIRADKIGLALRDRLIDAAGRGVKVRVLCDIVGSLFLGSRYVRELNAAGIEIRGIPGPHRALRRIGLNFRNHRKAVIVDGCIGFTGGLNVGDEYIDGGKYGSWRDTHLRLEGPMAQQLRHLFSRDWSVITGVALDAVPLPPAAGSINGLVTGFGPTDPLERGNLLLCALVGLAQRRLWIATPYLVPHTDLATAIQLAALRGVEVRFLIPRQSDNILVWYASRGYALSQLGLGITVFEYLPGFMHQKVILIDDDIASIGTVNLDVRSSLLNFEQTALIEDHGFAVEVEAMLTADFARAEPLQSPASWDVRLWAPVARLFDPLL